MRPTRGYSPETESYIASVFALIEARGLPPLTRQQFREFTKNDRNGPKTAQALCAEDRYFREGRGAGR